MFWREPNIVCFGSLILILTAPRQYLDRWSIGHESKHDPDNRNALSNSVIENPQCVWIHLVIKMGVRSVSVGSISLRLPQDDTNIVRLKASAIVDEWHDAIYARLGVPTQHRGTTREEAQYQILIYHNMLVHLDEVVEMKPQFGKHISPTLPIDGKAEAIISFFVNRDPKKSMTGITQGCENLFVTQCRTAASLASVKRSITMNSPLSPFITENPDITA